MKICKKCNKEFKTFQIIDGKQRNLHTRKFCLECSPFNTHNTKNFLNPNLVANIKNNSGSKKCGTCDIEKPLSEYYITKGGTAWYSCKRCMVERNTKQRIENKKLAIDYKGGKCVKCGYNKYYGALDFHHIDPNTKDKKLTAITSFDEIKDELDKCILVCSNCHREIHANITAI
jgi:hypothetical protein